MALRVSMLPILEKKALNEIKAKIGVGGIEGID